ncbi:MAG TPA: hypothetical protein VGS02_00050 [Acidobacteriaceae bacterium]|nr:hypothetical protein [Acidobacteriaceae bacterium]
MSEIVPDNGNRYSTLPATRHTAPPGLCIFRRKRNSGSGRYVAETSQTAPEKQQS